MGLDVLSNIRDAVGSLENFLDNGRGISVLKGIDWDKRWLWLIEFEKKEVEPPAPFDGWFPAHSVNINSRSQDGEEFSFGQAKLFLPTGMASSPNLSITFYDDINRTLYKWFDDWIRIDIQNGGKYVSGMLDDHPVEVPPSIGSILRNVQPVRTINVVYLNLDRSNYEVRKYAVVPSGDLSKDLSQDSSAVEYTMNFHIVGEDVQKGSGVDSTITDKVKDLLGRVI